jgi:hypothetical protein
MRVQIAVVAPTPGTETLSVRLIERMLRHLDYDVSVAGSQPDPSSAEMADMVAEARSTGLAFQIV